MTRWAAVIMLAIGIILVVLTPSDAWRRRRRRRCTRCRVSSWTSWSPCTRSCGGQGTTTRKRRITKTQSCGGGCQRNLKQTKSCNRKCCPVNCVYTWSSWSKCVGCGTSTQSRSPNIKRQRSCRGRACPPKQTRSCNTGV